MVFHRVERLDVLKMARLLVQPDFGEMALTPGARVLATLIHAMKDRGETSGLAALCLGGGNAVALSVEMR